MPRSWSACRFCAATHRHASSNCRSRKQATLRGCRIRTRHVENHLADGRPPLGNPRLRNAQQIGTEVAAISTGLHPRAGRPQPEIVGREVEKLAAKILYAREKVTRRVQTSLAARQD